MKEKFTYISLSILKRKILLFGILGFFIGSFWYVFFTPNYYKDYSPVEFYITKGSSLTKVVDNLYSKNIITNKFALKLAAFILRAESDIKAGRYEIPNGLSYFGLVDLILKGQPEEATLVTIQEGIWQHNLAGLFEEEMGISSDGFMKLSKDNGFIKSLGLSTSNLEGYLLPDTYYFTNSSDAAAILRKLVNETHRFFNDSLKQQMKKIGMTLHEVLTLASIIDGESNLVSEFKRISGVYHNRLKRGMRLQADPTVQFLIRDKRKSKRVYRKDWRIDSPYNTYMNKGLPPGPINNPGKEAILAALFPEEHKYLYFVTDGKGGHKFARTHSQHVRNAQAYYNSRGRR